MSYQHDATTGSPINRTKNIAALVVNTNITSQALTSSATLVSIIDKSATAAMAAAKMRKLIGIVSAYNRSAASAP